MTTTIPVIDLEPYLAREDHSVLADLTRGVRDMGVVIVRDPRLPRHLPARARDEITRFYRLPEEAKRITARPDTGHQIGWVPPFTELPRERIEERAGVPDGHKPTLHQGTRDVKERYSVPAGPGPIRTDYAAYNCKEPVVPDGFPEWRTVTETLADAMLAAVRTTIQAATIGLGANDPELFTRLMSVGPHLLAPTGCDLKKYGAPGTVHSGWHTDMSFLTVHGRSSHPGLFVWSRDLERIPVRMPDDGCLLIQAGKQWRICTGDVVHAGFHEVVAVPEIRASIERDIAKGLDPWRVSLTMFCHIASDEWLKPYDVFATPEAIKTYPPIQAGARQRRQLRRSGLEQAA